MSKRSLIFAVIILVIDQLSKLIISSYFKLNKEIIIIKKFFSLTLCHNEGVAWGLLSGKYSLIIIFMLIALVIIYKLIYCFKDNIRNNIAFGLLLGGLGGNLLDRLLYGYVIDFLDFYIFGYDYPVFNLADSAVVIGVILLIIAIFKGEDLGASSSK